MATASAPLRPLQVFVSYAHKDRQYAADLALHLRDLKDGGLIRLWTDWEIEPGKAWRPEILQQLQAADIVLLLVSADSINSDFVVHEEMRRAMERSDEGTARLIPIRVRPVFLSDHQPLARLQFLPSGPLAVSQWEDQDSAYVNIAEGVSRVAHQLWMKQMVTDAPSAPPPAIVPPPQPSPAPARVPDGGPGAVRAELGIPGRPHFWDVELRLEGGLLRGGFTVLALGAGAPGGEPVPMELNLPDLLLRAARVKSGAADPADAADLGARLYQALFPREVRQVWERGQKIMRADTLLRLRLDVQAPELALLPWELLRVPDEPLLDTGPPAGEPYAAAGAERGGYFLGMSPRRPILRWTRAPGAPPAPAPRLTGPLRLLLAVEGDRDAARRQAHRFRDLLADAVRARRVVVKAVSVTTLPDLLRRRRRHHHVVHYFGGGGPISAGARGEAGGPAEGGGRAALRLLVLTAAEGTPGDQVNAFVGMAQAAFTAGLPAVVATQGVMAPAAADAFDRAFYTALAEGLSLERCMADARQAVLRATGGAGVDWALPALFSQLEDGVLWEIAPAAPHEPAVRPPAAVLDNLPPPEPLPFSGRDEPLRTLRRLLGPGEGAVRIQLVGEGGSGRSALAYHAAREALERSRADPGGPEAFHAVIRVSARHGSPALSGSLRRQSPWSMDDLYAAVAAVLGKPGMSEVRPEERMAVLKEVLQGGRHLLVLDDVDLVADRRRDELLRALQPPNKAVLVCRTPLAVADEEVQVPPLEPESAAALLLADAAGARAQAVLRATPEERLALARLAGGLPFVLRWAVARLREPDARIDAVTRLLANADGEPLAEYCVRTSVDALDEEARVLLLAFALYPQPTTPEAAAAAAGPGLAYDEARERLIRLRLLRPADAPGRYRPILRARRYAQELLEDEKQRVFRECAVQRAIDFIQVAAQRDVERLAGEVGNVIWAALRAYEAERWAVLVEFRRRLDDFLYRRGHFNEALLLGDRAFDAADRLGDRTERAWCALYPLARVHQGQGSVEEARRWSGRALALFEQEDNHFGQAMACRELGRLLQAEGDAVRAEALFRRGVEHARRYDREADHFKLQARMQVGLAEITREQRRWSESEPLYRDALDLYRRAADEGGIAATLHALATLALERGNERAAEALLAESLSVLKDPRRREVRSARVWVTQALLADRRGDGAGAQALLRRAREVLHDDPGEVARIDAALARIAASAGYERRQPAAA